jgi:hypothetical protein
VHHSYIFRSFDPAVTITTVGFRTPRSTPPTDDESHSLLTTPPRDALLGRDQRRTRCSNWSIVKFSERLCAHYTDLAKHNSGQPGAASLCGTSVTGTHDSQGIPLAERCFSCSVRREIGRTRGLECLREAHCPYLNSVTLHTSSSHGTGPRPLSWGSASCPVASTMETPSTRPGTLALESVLERMP